MAKKVKKIGGHEKQEKLSGMDDVKNEAGKICDKILDISVPINQMVAQRVELEGELAKVLARMGLVKIMHDGVKFELKKTPEKTILKYAVPKSAQ